MLRISGSRMVEGSTHEPMSPSEVRGLIPSYQPGQIRPAPVQHGAMTLRISPSGARP